jgi:hypothetical protein
MNLNNFTIKSQEALEAARRLAEEHGQQEINALHLLHAPCCMPRTALLALCCRRSAYLPPPWSKTSTPRWRVCRR